MHARHTHQGTLQRRVGALVFLCALVVRLFFVLVNPTNVPVTPDKWARYDRIADRLLAGDGFALSSGPTAVAPPAYPLLLAATYAITGRSHTAPRIVLAVLDAGICLAFFVLSRRLLGPRVALVTGLALALCPYLVYLVLTAGSDDLFLLFLALSLLLLNGATSAQRWTGFFAGGVGVGLATLTRATSLLLPLALCAALVLAARQRRRALVWCTGLLLGFVLTIAPWTIRNAVHFKRLIPMQTLGGMHFLLGAATEKDRETWKERHQDEETFRTGPERDSAQYRYGLELITEHPGAFARQSARRLITMWTTSHSQRLDRVLAPVNFSLLLLAAVGAWLRRDRWRELLPLYATLLYFVAVHSLMVVIFRYLVPVVPILVMLAAVPVVRVVDRLTGRPSPDDPAW